ncbi:hypothetical protein AK812_SmicGene25365 [Symbiodinium microadriaticum]|uniref:Uncharacterized protein n=1 Tax=Symbiodinium microadriaticum TaxID=2951 RepID=A0A1Q9DC77_SYMMI|nr:hypothetical protein AK812_SmicGene25365 [Symbiodinium microadriaticum]
MGKRREHFSPRSISCFAVPGEIHGPTPPKPASAPIARAGSRVRRAAGAQSKARKMTPKQWAKYLFSVHGVSGVLSVLAGSIWTTVRLAKGIRQASHAEVVFNVVLSAVILLTGMQRLRTIRNQDVVLKFWVGISIQIFALCQVLEAPLLGWIPYSIFGNWISRLWGILSVYFYVKWLMQIKKWNEAFETNSDQTVARIFHPLMAPAMGSVVVMEVVTFVNFVELNFNLVSRCVAAQALFLDSQLVSLAVNNVAQFTLTLANQKKVANIQTLFYVLGAIGTVQFALLMWVHLKSLGPAALNPLLMIPLVCRGA